jgi:hypothetical protein
MRASLKLFAARRSGEQMMQASELPISENQKSSRKESRENPMDTDTGDLFELLQQNAKWWEQAAVTCEGSAAQLPSGAKEELQLLGAVYRERAQKFSKLIEGLGKNGVTAHT